VGMDSTLSKHFIKIKILKGYIPMHAYGKLLCFLVK
jgi:hypothetical protein